MKPDKKIYPLILALALAVLQLMPCAAYAKTAALTETVRVGYFETEGFLEKDQTGALSGYAADYFQAIISYADWAPEFVCFSSYEDYLEKLASGEIDLVCGITKTEISEGLFDFPSIESGRFSAALFVKNDNLSYAENDYPEFDGIRIGILEGDENGPELSKFAESNGFAYTYNVYRDKSALIAAISSGEIDALLLNTLHRIENFRIIAKFNPSPFYFSAAKGNKKVLSDLDYALDKIKSANPYFDLELNKKHYSAVEASIAFTAAEKEYLRGNPTVRVVFDANWYPLEYLGDKGEFMGFTRKMFDLIGQNVTLQGGGTLVFEYYYEESFSRAVDSFSEGRYDVLASIATDYRYGILANGRLTDTLLSSGIVMVENSAASGNTMILPKGYYITKLAEKIRADSYDIVYADTIKQCFDALKKGNAKYTLVNTYIADSYLSRADYVFLTSTAFMGISEDISIAVHYSAPDELYSIISKAVDYISLNQKNEILRDTLIESTVYSLRDWPYRNPTEFFAVLSLFIVAIISISVVIIISQRYNKKRLYKSLMYDKLTGLYIKEGFFIETEKKIKNNPDALYAFIHFNLVQFKVVNELFGYSSGDELLKYCGQLIADFAGPDSVCARTEGDHYLICMPYNRVDIKIIGILEEKLSEFQKSIHINAKAGIYVVDNKNLSITAMYDRALLALKEAQRNVDRKYCFYDERLKNSVVEEQEILSEFSSALMGSQFEVYYQPIISLAEKRPVSAEALVRWKHPVKGTVSPGVFIPILENNGLIAQLDYYVWEEVFKYARSRMDRNRMPLNYSINLSRVHLYSTKFVDVLSSLATRYDIPPEIISVEVTETAYIQDTRYFAERLSLLKKKGFKVVMDDFGSGFSSLNALGDFPIDIVKLDIAFFTAKKKARANSIIMSTIQMLHNIGMSVVAEGVETKEQAELLYSLGCDSIQGFYFYKPMNIGDFERADDSRIVIGSAEIMKNRNKIQMDLSQLKNIENFKGMDTLVEAIPCGFGVFHFSHAEKICKADFLSEGIESFLGYESNRGYELSKNNISGLIHPHDLKAVYSGLEKALREKRFFEEEFRMKDGGGEYKWLSFRANAAEKKDDYSLWYGVFTNIDSYRKANEELAKVNEFYKGIYDTMICGVAQYTYCKCKLVAINKAGCEIFGFADSNECIEKFDLKKATYADDESSRAEAFAKACETKTAVPFEHRVVRPDGCVNWIKGAVQYHESGGKKWYQCTFVLANDRIYQ